MINIKTTISNNVVNIKVLSEPLHYKCGALSQI